LLRAEFERSDRYFTDFAPLHPPSETVVFEVVIERSDDRNLKDVGPNQGDKNFTNTGEWISSRLRGEPLQSLKILIFQANETTDVGHSNFYHPRSERSK
jgi:hypothetical protein